MQQMRKTFLAVAVAVAGAFRPSDFPTDERTRWAPLGVNASWLGEHIARGKTFLARAGALGSREAELARGAELKAAKRALLVATRTLEACELHGLVRRAPGGAIEVCEIPVTTVAPEPSSRGREPPRGLLPKAARVVADDDGTEDEHDEH